MTQLVTEEMRNKWKPVIEGETKSTQRLTKDDILVRMMENQQEWINNNQAMLRMDEAVPTNATGAGIATWAPVLIKMVKRVAPNLVAQDFFGVQPLSTPDGLIFAMRARYSSQTGAEAFYQNINSGFSGTGADAGSVSGVPVDTVSTGVPAANPTTGTGMATATAEDLGAGTAWAKMALSIEKQTVSAKSRGLYADYSHELRQDLMAVHGQDVDNILSDMLVTEIQAEMNREFIRTMNIAGKLGAVNATKAGVFDLAADTDGRWFLERLKGFMFQLELDANEIAKDTRRGKGNRILCSANVASSLAMAGMLDFTPALAQNADLEVDVTGQTFAGVLANGMRVYIDPYADLEYYNIGYKGPTEMDAGIFFAPYTPLEMYRTQGQDTFAPRIAFKTRYGITANPFYAQDAGGTPTTGSGLGQSSNGYFRKAVVTNLF